MGKSTSVKALAASSFGLVVSGTISFFYTFFTEVYPATQSKINVLENEIKAIHTFEQRILDDLKEIRVTQKEMYVRLINEKRNK